MRGLIFSDLHLHLWRKFGTDAKTGLPKRLKEQLDVMDEIGSLIVTEKIDFVINGGDLAHKVGEIPVEVINFIHSKFTDWCVPIYSVGGNHDVLNREAPKWYESSIDYFQKRYWEEMKGPELIQNHNVKIAGVDFGCLGNWPPVALTGNDIVVVHDVPEGCKYGDYTFEKGVSWRDLARDNRFVFFGHIHQKQKLADNCWVIGPPLHLTFSDSGDRGVFIVDTFRNDMKFVEINAPKFITVDDASGVKDDKNYYRILNADKKSEAPNAVTVVTPKYYEERIKSSDLAGTVEEWAKISEAPDYHLEYIRERLGAFTERTIKVTDGRIKTVEVKDFGSVGEAHYELKKGSGFVLVSGESDVFDSNGAGKTTMTGDAILWALFGETTKGLTGDDVIRRGEKDCSVTVTLKEENVTYFINRTRSKGLVVEDMDSDGKGHELTLGLRQADRQKILEDQVLGFGKTLFMASCYFSQEEILTLTGLGDASRNNLITDLLGFDKYDALYEICSDDIKKKNDAVAVEESNLQKIANKKELQREKIGDCERRVSSYRQEIVEVGVKTSKIREEIEVKEREIVEAKSVSVKGELDEARVELGEVEKELQVAESKRESKEEMARAQEKEYYEFVSKRTAAQSEIKGHQKVVNESKRRIDRFKSLTAGEVCDYCGSTVTEDNTEKFVADEEAKITEIATLIQELTVKEDKLREEQEDSDKKHKGTVNECIELGNFMKERKSDIRILSKKIDDLQKKANEQEIERARLRNIIDSYLKSIQDHEANIEKYEKWIADVEDSIGDYEVAIRQLNEKVEQTNKMIDEMKLFVSSAEFWKNAFSPKGIKSLLIDRFCNQFNSIANGYLSEISSGEMSITMSPTSVLKSGEERNKLSMDIALDGYTVNYKSLSGGEKRRVDVSLCLALNEWVSQRFNITDGLLGVIIFDEIFSYLDRLAEETIGTILYREGHKKCILVISHTSELASYAGYSMRIVRRNGVSQLNSIDEKSMAQDRSV